VKNNQVARYSKIFEMIQMATYSGADNINKIKENKYLKLDGVVNNAA
jgi:hypothetical protein